MGTNGVSVQCHQHQIIHSKGTDSDFVFIVINTKLFTVGIDRDLVSIVKYTKPFTAWIQMVI